MIWASPSGSAPSSTDPNLSDWKLARDFHHLFIRNDMFFKLFQWLLFVVYFVDLFIVLQHVVLWNEHINWLDSRRDIGSEAVWQSLAEHARAERCQMSDSCV